MKINAMPGYSVFRKDKATVPNSAPVKSAPSDPKNDVDIVSFSRNPSAALDKELLTIRSSILTETARPTGAQSLADVQESIRAGTYRRSTDDIVGAILGKPRA